MPQPGSERSGRRNMRRTQGALLVVLAVAGLYFLIWHRDLPLNHEAIGLGMFHLLHDVIGVVLLGLAALVWWRSRRSAKAVTGRGHA